MITGFFLTRNPYTVEAALMCDENDSGAFAKVLRFVLDFDDFSEFDRKKPVLEMFDGNFHIFRYLLQYLDKPIPGHI